MTNHTNMYDIFKDWVMSNYKRSAALMLCQTLEAADDFLLEIRVVKGKLFDLEIGEIRRHLDELKRNRVFKFRNREFMPWIEKLCDALTGFAQSESYQNAAPAEAPAEVVTPVANVNATPPDEQAIRNVLSKCVISLEGNVISKEDISQSFLSFLSEASCRREHNVGISLHTGSVIFDALAVLWAALSGMLANTISPEELVHSLEPGSLIEDSIYGRCRFDGIIIEAGEEKAVFFQTGRGGTEFRLPVSLWYRIMPYQGKSKTLDGRGKKSGKAKRIKFYEQVLNIRVCDIPSVTDVSAVFVMAHEKADMLVNGLSIGHDGETYTLLDLVTASWYTDAEEYPYSGNAGKNEPVLKFTRSVSTARKLLLKRDGNRHAGLFICDGDELRRGESELPELLGRRSLQYAHVLTDLDSDQGEKLVTENETAEVFACTKDFLLSCPLQLREDNEYTRDFAGQVDAILDHEISYILSDGFVDWKTWRDFRATMFSLKDSEYEAQSKTDFIVEAWSLFKLFRTMPFPMRLFEEMTAAGELRVESTVEKRIENLKQQAADFPDDLVQKANDVVALLEGCYLALDNTTSVAATDITPEDDGKYADLVRLIRARADKRVCVVVPKRYYVDVMRKAGFFDLMDDPNMLTITTANQFDRSRTVDTVIVVGEFRGKHFDCFRCRSAREVISLLYACEKNPYKKNRRQSALAERIYNGRSFAHVTTEDFDDANFDDDASDEEISRLERMSEDMDSFLEELSLRDSILPRCCGNGSACRAETETVAVALFETGEKAFFTPFYEACVYDEAKEEISERRVSDKDLCEGDLVVFTRMDDEMHDIVDDIMQMLIQRGKLTQEEHIANTISKRWKNKLRMYMRLSGMSAKDVATRMEKNGVPITAQAVRVWTDPQAHHVGPRNAECIRQIGILVDDEDMARCPEDTMQACRIVRHRRKEILKVIEKSIRNKLCGRSNRSSDPLEREIFDRIESQADILRVESFARIKKTLPIAYVNKPLNV